MSGYLDMPRAKEESVNDTLEFLGEGAAIELQRQVMEIREIDLFRKRIMEDNVFATQSLLVLGYGVTDLAAIEWARTIQKMEQK